MTPVFLNHIILEETSITLDHEVSSIHTELDQTKETGSSDLKKKKMIDCQMK
jgi:hypothetical protein